MQEQAGGVDGVGLGTCFGIGLSATSRMEEAAWEHGGLLEAREVCSYLEAIAAWK